MSEWRQEEELQPMGEIWYGGAAFLSYLLHLIALLC